MMGTSPADLTSTTPTYAWEPLGGLSDLRIDEAWPAQWVAPYIVYTIPIPDQGTCNTLIYLARGSG